jgi:hypothetical protein
VVSKPVLALVSKPVWKDEKTTVTYDKFTMTPIAKELPELHG